MGLVTAASNWLTASRRGVLTILAGTATGQLVALLAAPLLTRLYSPEDFGVLSILSALIVTGGTVAAFRFELAIPLPERERDAYSLVILGLISCVFTATAGTLVVAAAGDAVAGAFDQPQLLPWLWLVPLMAAVMGVYLVLNQLAIRMRRYRAVGRRNLVHSVTMVTAQVAAGAASFRPGGLVVGLAFGQAAGALSLVSGAGLSGSEARAGRRKECLQSAALRYRGFPLVLAPSGLLNALGLQLPILLIAYWYGSEVAGWLGLTQRVLALPVTLIGTAVAQVYLGELARAVRSDPRRAILLFRRGTHVLVAVAAVIAVALTVLGPWAFSTLFGSQWEESGLYARALALALAAQLVAVPLSQTLVTLERQWLQVAWDVLRVTTVFAAVAIAVAQEASALTAVWILGTSSAVLYGISWIFCWMSLMRLESRSAESVE